MKKKVKFEHTIEFSTMIGEITAISLEKDLSFKNQSYIEGNLILKGKYKLTEASIIEEYFEYKVPIEITLTEKVDIATANVDISDFYYEIKENDSLICNIELIVDALEIIDDYCDERECDGDVLESEIPTIEESIEIDSKNDISEDSVKVSDEKKIKIDKEIDDSLFVHLNDEAETYGTFIVYIVRQNETINSIIEKYNTSVEELEKYNNLKDINIGTKLIIPVLND